MTLLCRNCVRVCVCVSVRPQRHKPNVGPNEKFEAVAETSWTQCSILSHIILTTSGSYLPADSCAVTLPLRSGMTQPVGRFNQRNDRNAKAAFELLSLSIANKNALKTTNQWMNKMKLLGNCWATVGTMSPTGTHVWNDQPARGYCFTITGSRLQLISTVHPWLRVCWPGTKIKQVAIAFISSRTTKQ